MAILSNNLNRDTIALHNYQTLIIDNLKGDFSRKKIFYFTDGAEQHYKNKW